MNNINNNVNFTARMDVSQITMNKSRWQKIATLFEKETQKYPNDEFRMRDLPNGVGGYNYNPQTYDEISVNVEGVEFDRLLNMDDNVIVSKFKKILDIGAKKRQIYNETDKFIKKLSKIVKKTGIDDIENKIWDNSVDIAVAETKTLQNKDKFLKDIEILY